MKRTSCSLTLGNFNAKNSLGFAKTGSLVYEVEQPIGQINARLGDPYMISETIAPNTNTFNIDKPCVPSGLSYTSFETAKRDENLIRTLYRDIHNIEIPKDTFIITSCGSTHLGAALIYAVQRKLDKSIVLTAPRSVTYGIYRNVSESMLRDTSWVDEEKTADLCVVVSPNNPDGYVFTESDFLNLRDGGNPDMHILADLIYDTPLFTSQSTVNPWLWDYFSDDSFGMREKTFILSSFSKLGIAGARYGFVLVNDKDIADSINEYIFNTVVVGPTAGAQLAFNNYNIYWRDIDWHIRLYKKMEKRRQQFNAVAPKRGITVLNLSNYAPYIYTDKSQEWWVDNYNVKTRVGTDFNDTIEHSRISLMLLDREWDELIRRLS